jgi:hypothetical protein
MRLLTPLPQDDLTDVPAAARAAEAVAISGGYGVRQDVPSAVVEEIHRIPSVFAGYRTAW